MSDEKRIVGWCVKYPDGSYGGERDWHVEKAARAVYTDRAHAINYLTRARRYDREDGVLVRITRRKKPAPAEIPEPRVGMRVEWTERVDVSPKFLGPRTITRIEGDLIFAPLADGHESLIAYMGAWADRIRSGDLRILPDEPEIPEPKVGMRVEWTETASAFGDLKLRGPRTITRIESSGDIFATLAGGGESCIAYVEQWANAIRGGFLRILPDEPEIPELRVGTPDEPEIPEPRVGMRVEWAETASEFGNPKLRGPRVITRIEHNLIFAPRADGHESSMMFTGDWAREIRDGHLRILPDEPPKVEPPAPRMVAVEEVLAAIDERIANAQKAEEAHARNGAYRSACDSRVMRYTAENIRTDVLKLAKVAP